MQVDMPVTIDHLLTVGSNGYHLDRGVGKVCTHHHRRVLIARLVVTEDTDVLQARQLQPVKHVSCRTLLFTLAYQFCHISIQIARRVVVTPVSHSVHTSIDIKMYRTAHVTKQELGHLQRELAHVELAVRQTVVRQVIVQVIGITHISWFLPVDGTAATTTSLHIDIL